MAYAAAQQIQIDETFEDDVADFDADFLAQIDMIIDRDIVSPTFIAPADGVLELAAKVRSHADKIGVAYHLLREGAITPNVIEQEQTSMAILFATLDELTAESLRQVQQAVPDDQPMIVAIETPQGYILGKSTWRLESTLDYLESFKTISKMKF